jgi:hypothetical protein
MKSMYRANDTVTSSQGLVLLLLGISPFVSGTLADLQSNRSNYGEPCNRTQKCLSQSWLACDMKGTKTCICAKPEEMVFDPLKQKCVGLVGEQCKFGFDEDERNLWYEKADCVNNAQCGPSGICSCQKGFYDEPELFQCSPVKSFGKSCKKNDECNQDKFLSCLMGICQCDPDNALYNTKEFSYDYPNPQYIRYYSSSYVQSHLTVTIPSGICIGRVGSSCSKAAGKHCVQNSKCSDSSATCECDSSYTVTSDKLCGLGYNQVCSETTVCSDTLRCHGKVDTNHKQTSRCLCPNPQYQDYDSTTGSCMGKLGSSCDPFNPKSCTQGTSCRDTNGMFQCECPIDFVETGDGKCQIAYGKACKYQDGANEDSSGLCDGVADLDCKGFRCSCKNEVDVYELERRQCSLTVGMRCDETSQCVENASCVKPKNGKLRGKCQCLDGFEVIKNGTCSVVDLALLFLDNQGSPEATEIEIMQQLGAGNYSAATVSSDGSNDFLKMMKDEEFKADSSSNEMV